MYKPKIIIVDDDADILDLLEVTLKDEYEVIPTSCGKEALEKIKEELPDFIVLDYMLPDISGIEICQTLRKDPLFLHTPILLLTGKGEITDKIRGLEAGTDDYMVKPFNPQELLARIRMIIRRSTIHLDANPLTRLPGNVSINKEFEEHIANEKPFAVLYIDINHFKAVNDYYGFKRGDDVIKKTARIIIDTVQELGTIEDFIGHIGGDDFVIITTPEKAENIAKQIITDFDAIAPLFFDDKERRLGYIETKDRDNNLHKFPILTLAIGIVTNLSSKFNHTAQISSQGTEVKNLAKKSPTSKYIFDRRGNTT